MIRIYKALSRNLDIEYIDCDIIYYYKNNIAILKRFNFNDIINNDSVIDYLNSNKTIKNNNEEKLNNIIDNFYNENKNNITLGKHFQII